MIRKHIIQLNAYGDYCLWTCANWLLNLRKLERNVFHV